MEAIKEEQRRIQRLIDLTSPSSGIAPLARATMNVTDPGNTSADSSNTAAGSRHTSAGSRNVISDSRNVITDPGTAGADPQPGVKAADTIGRLSIQARGDRLYCYEYFYQNGRRIHKKYLGTVESVAVRNHLAARFCKERLRVLRQDQKVLQQMTARYQPYDPASIIADMPRTYRRAVEGNAFNQCFNERYEELRQWADADYPRNNAPLPAAEIFASDGTRTRSKGECLHYNIYHARGIFFRYDSLIEIKDPSGQIHLVSPDFLIQCFDGTFIIIEHLGRLDSMKYAMTFGEKCHLYQQAGFVLGKNFFVTSDDLYGGTDSQMIQNVAAIVERKFYGF